MKYQAEMLAQVLRLAQVKVQALVQAVPQGLPLLEQQAVLLQQEVVKVQRQALALQQLVALPQQAEPLLLQQEVPLLELEVLSNGRRRFYGSWSRLLNRHWLRCRCRLWLRLRLRLRCWSHRCGSWFRFHCWRRSRYTRCWFHR